MERDTHNNTVQGNKATSSNGATDSAADRPADVKADSPADSPVVIQADGPADSRADIKVDSPATDNPSYFRNADGQKLYRRYWKPNLKDGEKPRALVHIGHGFREHSGWYDPLGEALSKQGILVFAHDYVGHGRSEGEKIEVDSFSVYPRDSIQFMDLMKAEYPDCPLFAFGYSIGGSSGLAVAAERPGLLTGLILEGPPMGQMPMPLAKRMVLKLLSILRPSYGIFPFQVEHLFTDPVVRQRYIDDELSSKAAVSAGCLWKLLQGVKETASQLSSVTCPLLILHGEKDVFCSAIESGLLFGCVASTDKTLKTFPGAAHNVMMEKNGQGEEFVDDTVNWIVKRLQ